MAIKTEKYPNGNPSWFKVGHKSFMDEKVKTKLSYSLKMYNNDPLVRERKKQEQIKRYSNPNERLKQGIITKKLWESEEYAKKVMARREPNYAESKLLKAISDNDLTYYYTGCLKNCKRTAGKIVDYTHFSENKVIELFGEMWHEKDEELKRQKYFEDRGYKCLIIWAKELDNINAVVDKIRRF